MDWSNVIIDTIIWLPVLLIVFYVGKVIGCNRGWKERGTPMKFENKYFDNESINPYFRIIKEERNASKIRGLEEYVGKLKEENKQLKDEIDVYRQLTGIGFDMKYDLHIDIPDNIEDCIPKDIVGDFIRTLNGDKIEYHDVLVEWEVNNVIDGQLFRDVKFVNGIGEVVINLPTYGYLHKFGYYDIYSSRMIKFSWNGKYKDVTLDTTMFQNYVQYTLVFTE